MGECEIDASTTTAHETVSAAILAARKPGESVLVKMDRKARDILKQDVELSSGSKLFIQGDAKGAGTGAGTIVLGKYSFKVLI